MDFQIAPFRSLRFHGDEGNRDSRDPSQLVAPPYDIIGPDEHRELLKRSPFNIVRLTLGEQPGEREEYKARGERLASWKRDGILREDSEPAFCVYGCDYTVPGGGERARFRGLAALGRLHPFRERVVHPHERTFPAIVDDRYRLLEVTRTHLELIFVLYEDREKAIDRILLECSSTEPQVSVEVKPGETHALWPLRDREAIDQLQKLFRPQRPIIADGHHRYTTSLLYRERAMGNPALVPGSAWQPMVFGNLVGGGLSILATHRLVPTPGRAAEAVGILKERLEPVAGPDPSWDLAVETVGESWKFRIPREVRQGRKGVAATDYAILHEVILSEWLRPLLPETTGGEFPGLYFKEGSGEREALERGQGDLLFRMRPVSPSEFRDVVEGGEVFPHKTTFFYPKLWSGLVLWSLSEPEQP